MIYSPGGALADIGTDTLAVQTTEVAVGCTQQVSRVERWRRDIKGKTTTKQCAMIMLQGEVDGAHTRWSLVVRLTLTSSGDFDETSTARVLRLRDVLHVGSLLHAITYPAGVGDIIRFDRCWAETSSTHLTLGHRGGKPMHQPRTVSS